MTTAAYVLTGVNDEGYACYDATGPDEVTEAIDAPDDDNVYCECGAALTDTEIDEFGEQCQACYMASHFRCLECESDYELDEQSEKNKCLCCSCQETKDEEEAAERLDAAKDAAREALEAILDGDDIDAIKKALKSLKRLAK